jgi:hypothetical protein
LQIEYLAIESINSAFSKSSNVIVVYIFLVHILVYKCVWCLPQSICRGRDE